MPRLRPNGAILLGGASRRMGRPKAAIHLGGRSFLERAIDVLLPCVRRIVLVGRLPAGVNLVKRHRQLEPPITRLDDAAGFAGPLAGVISALESEPAAEWLVLPCDMPGLTTQAVGWLIDQHQCGSTATVGILPGREDPEPFPVIFSASPHASLRQPAPRGDFSLAGFLKSIDARAVPIPAFLSPQWQNLNTREDLERFIGSSQPTPSASPASATT